jgi:glycerol-3-phosphate dehydrogenase
VGIRLKLKLMKSVSSPESIPPQRDPGRLTRLRHDVLIIGGGINGAGIARDLALRGLRVALVEKGDFASGASSASTKLVHGGVRYLENFDFHLVFEACRERRILQSIAPHLVRPVPFFIPVYEEDPRSLWTIRAGMTLYDTLALFRNTHHHSILAAAEATAREPALRTEGLAGVALYWDCRMDDARLCLENVLAAVKAGAMAENYLEVTALLKDGGRLRGVRLRDQETGEELEVEAQVVINATGPWLDKLCALDGEPEGKLRPTRGTHILVPRINRGEEALYLTAGRDDRLFFVIPWGGLSLIGTTDVDFPGDPDEVAPAEEDIEYLLAETGRHLQGTTLRRSNVVAAFSGLRPLVAEKSVKAFRVSREHRVFESASGLISVGGGKYTTYRAVAAKVAARATERLGRGGGRSITHRIPLPGGITGHFASFLRREAPILSGQYGLSTKVLVDLLNRYGSRTRHLLTLLREDPDLARPVVAGSSLLAVQVVYGARFEFARSPEDILRRRTNMALEEGRGLAELEAVAAILSRCLNVPDEGRNHWKNTYLEHYSTL